MVGAEPSLSSFPSSSITSTEISVRVSSSSLEQKFRDDEWHASEPTPKRPHTTASNANSRLFIRIVVSPASHNAVNANPQQAVRDTARWLAACVRAYNVDACKPLSQPGSYLPPYLLQCTTYTTKPHTHLTLYATSPRTSWNPPSPLLLLLSVPRKGTTTTLKIGVSDLHPRRSKTGFGSLSCWPGGQMSCLNQATRFPGSIAGGPRLLD